MKKLSLPQVTLKCKKMYYLTEIWFDSQFFMNEKQKFGWKDYIITWKDELFGTVGICIYDMHLK